MTGPAARDPLPGEPEHRDRWPDAARPELAPEWRDVRQLRTALTINARAEGPISAAAALEMLDVAPVPGTDDEFAEHFIDANERMGEAITAIGMALGLGRPGVGNTWGAPEILDRIAEWKAAQDVLAAHAGANLRPDTGGRDLTAQDVRDAVMVWVPVPEAVCARVADRLNRIARAPRPSGAVCICPQGQGVVDPECPVHTGPDRSRWSEPTGPAAGPRADDTAPDCRGRDCGRDACPSCSMMRAYYERLDGDTAPAWPGVGSAEGTYDRIVAEAQRSWTHWSGLHGIEPFAVDRAIEQAVHITISTLQQDPCIAPGGDTAPDDEDVLTWLHEASIGDPDHEQAAMAARALGVIQDRDDELDRLRSEAAALRAAGDALATTVAELLAARGGPTASLAYGRLATRLDAWRSAAGSPTTEGGEQT